MLTLRKLFVYSVAIMERIVSLVKYVVIIILHNTISISRNTLLKY